MQRAFVSHSTADDHFVAEIELFLHAAGIDEVFNDVHTIKPDEQFWAEIEKGIEGCDSFFVIITAASNASEWVKREVEFARSLSKRVTPIWVEDCPLPPIFADRDVIDLRPRARERRRTDISRIFKYAPANLIGRKDETKLLSDAWGKVLRAETGRPRVLTFVAFGGEGKTSLVAKWAADLAAQDWVGCDAAFAWSFYSQGTREQVAASSDLFLKEALTFFGDEADKEFAASPAGAFEKGRRLARVVGQRRSLLILDGLEPLQYAPTSPTPGQLKDQGIAALLKGLAAASHGVCLVTTRYSLPDLRAFWQITAPEVKLLRLSREAGVHLLKTLGVRKESGSVQEFEKLVEDVKGHALTLTLLGGFLKRAFRGDIRQRNRVKFERADERMDGGHAFRTIAAYEQWLLRDGGEEGRREVAVLRLMGLFDRPADADCLAALRRDPIPGLTEPLAELADDDWEFCLSGLEAAKLLTVNRDVTGALASLDAHPHLRAYFAKQLRKQQPDAWRAAHRQLFEHLCATTKEGDQPTLEALQPLYQAVAHGCQAGLHQEACDKVYKPRLIKDDEHYTWKALGAVGSDLGATACFFEAPWCHISPVLKESSQAFLLNQTALYLFTLGRLIEALDPMRFGLAMRIKQENWMEAAINANNLSELELTLGDVAGAVESAETSVTYADRSGDLLEKRDERTTHADALHQAGCWAEAEAKFREAEQLQAVREPDYPLLYSLWGFRYCELLLASSERSVWKIICSDCLRLPEDVAHAVLQAVSQRSEQTFTWCTTVFTRGFLSIALEHLTLARVALYKAILVHGSRGEDAHAGGSKPVCRDGKESKGLFTSAATELDAAVSCLRSSGDQSMLPRAILTRAWLRCLVGTRNGPDSSQEDLDEAWEIAERGPMKLHMADVHLHRARLFFRESKYPWESPDSDLAAAGKLIKTCGYHRRDEELADAKAAILSK